MTDRARQPELVWPARWRRLPEWWQAQVAASGTWERRAVTLDSTGERTPAWWFGAADSHGARVELTSTRLRTYRGDALFHDLLWDAVHSVEACRHNSGGDGPPCITAWVRLHLRPPVGAGLARRVLPYIYPAIDDVDLWPSELDADPRALFWACTEFLDPARRTRLLAGDELLMEPREGRPPTRRRPGTRR